MKRAILSLLALGVVCAGMAQSSFTIVRPANNAKVREVVRVLFPMSSVGDNGYVGIFLNGKFLEAIKPGKGAEYLYYDLNTKARGIPDGPLTIEAVLYQELADRPRIVDRSSITVEVANSSSIPVPENGIKLRYKFTPGKQWVYKFENRIAVNNLSEIDSTRISTENLLAGAQSSSIRLLYSVDNAYSNGDGLLRIQALPDKGRDYTRLVTADKPDQEQTYYDYQMHPLYMRLTNTGREVFGSAPTYFPFERTTAEAFRTDLYALYPLPMLPGDPMKPGDTPQVGITLGDLDLDKKDQVNTLVTKIPGVRGEFVGVEWERNHPCAHLRYLRADKLPDGLKGSGRLINAQRVEEDIYFALDLGAVLKLVRTYTIDTKVTVPVGGGAAPAGGGNGSSSSGGGAPSISGATGIPGGGGGGGAAGAGSGILRPPLLGGGGSFPLNLLQGSPSFGGASIPGQNTPPPGQGQFGRGGRAGGNTTRIVRVTVQEVFSLEK